MCGASLCVSGGEGSFLQTGTSVLWDSNAFLEVEVINNTPLWQNPALEVPAKGNGS